MFHLYVRDVRREFIRSKYERHRYVIVTCAEREDLKQELKQAVLSKDLFSLLQVFAEGLELSTTLPDMVGGLSGSIIPKHTV